MQKLAKREEQIMEVFWSSKKAFIKDVIPALPNPKPHYNSVATMVKILEEKGFLNHTVVGHIFEYFPVILKEDYQKYAVKDIVDKYFDNSYSNMVAFFAREQKISEQELNDIMNIIKKTKNGTL